MQVDMYAQLYIVYYSIPIYTVFFFVLHRLKLIAYKASMEPQDYPGGSTIWIFL